MAEAVCIVGSGVVTSVGTTAVAAAAVRAGLTRISLEPEDAEEDDDEVAHVARIAPAPADDATERAGAVLRLAVADAMAVVASDGGGSRPLRFGVWIAGDLAGSVAERLAADVAGRLGHPATSVSGVGGGGAASLAALKRAAEAVASGQVDVALVAAHDDRAAGENLKAALHSGRVAAPSQPWGFVPGEAAAAVLLTKESTAGRLGWLLQGRLSGFGSGSEPHGLGSLRPCTGSGLTDAVQAALAQLPPDAQVTDVLCDLNGERLRTDEWGFTLPRLGRRLLAPGEFVAPASAWGDCGACNGLLLVCLATSNARRGFATGRTALVWVSSDGTDRQALVTLGAADDPSSSVPYAERPQWATALDDDVFREMVDESVFRFEQRDSRLEALSTSLTPDWQSLGPAEVVLDALVDGLAEGGERAVQAALAVFDPGTPATVYSLIRALLERGDHEQAMTVTSEQADEAPVRAATLAFLHARGAAGAAATMVPRLLQRGDNLTWIALAIAAANATPLSLQDLGPSIEGTTAEHHIVLARCLGRVGAADDARMLGEWFRSEHDAVRMEAALAQLRLNGPSAEQDVIRRAEQDPALILPAALVIDPAQAPELVARACASGPATGSLAALLAGTVECLPQLLDRLTPEDAWLPFALHALLGDGPVEEIEQPDEDPESEEASRVTRLSRDAAAWAPAVDRARAQHPPTQRLRSGQVASARLTHALLGEAALPPLMRRWLGTELELTSHIRPAFDPTGLVRLQRAWLSRAADAGRNR